MGRRDKSYSRDLKQQIHDRLTGMLAIGEGKKQAVADGTDRNKIFSYNTYQTYRKHCNYFATYVRENHPECTTIRKARKYVNEWLQSRVDKILDCGIITKPVSVPEIHRWAKERRKIDPDCFIASLR